MFISGKSKPSEEVMRRLFLLVFTLILFLSGCGRYTQPSPGFSISPTELRPTDTLPSAIAITPTPMAGLQPVGTVPVDFPSPSIASSIKQRCLSIGNTLSENANLTGSLILDSRLLDPLTNIGQIVQIVFPSLETHLMPQALGVEDLELTQNSISPNRRWFFYFTPSSPGSGGYLQVATIDGQEQEIPFWDTSWGEDAMWLNDQSLVIRLPSRDGTVIVINPFSGHWQKLIPDFASGLNTDFPLVYYSPNLTRAVYISGNYFVLWDAQNKRDLWRKQGVNFSMLSGGWSPDGSRFAMVVTDKDNVAGVVHSDVYVVNQNGEETRLTQFTNAYPPIRQIFIDDLEWSPDGKYLALSLEIKDGSSLFKEPTLMIASVETKDVTDYCLVVSQYDGNIVWSPSGKQLVITSPIDFSQYMTSAPKGERQHTQVILIDIGQGSAIKIAEDTASVGWMVAP